MRKREGTRMRRSAAELTARQQQVLGLMARGYTNGQIAEALGISLDGAKAHVSEIIARLDVSSREEAVNAWRNRRRGFLAGLGTLAGLKFAGAGAAGGLAVAALGVAAWVAWSPGEGDGNPWECAPAGASPQNGTETSWEPDLAPFVRFGDIMYVQSDAPAGAITPTEPYGRVETNVLDARIAADVEIDCSAAFLPVGTMLYAVEDYEPTFRLATEDGTLYQSVSMRRSGRGEDFIDIVGKVDFVRLGPKDGSAPQIDVDDDGLASDLAEAIEQGMHNPGLIPRDDWEGIYVEFVLRDGTVFGGGLRYSEDFDRSTFNQITLAPGVAGRVAERYRGQVMESETAKARLLLRAAVASIDPEKVSIRTEYRPSDPGRTSEVATYEFGDGVVRVRIEYDGSLDSDECHPGTFGDHWLASVGEARPRNHPFGEDPHSFSVGQPVGPGRPLLPVRYEYREPTDEGGFPVTVTVWVDAGTNELVRVEREMADPFGFQGLAVTEIRPERVLEPC